MSLRWLGLGFLLGAITGTLNASGCFHGIDGRWVSTLLMPITAIGLAVWIHKTLHKRSVVGRVPMDHIADSCRKINELLRDCVAEESAQGERTVAFKQLSNEIDWLLEIPRAVRPISPALEGDLVLAYFDLKRHLTWDTPPEPATVNQLVRQIKTKALRIEVSFTARILEFGVETETP